MRGLGLRPRKRLSQSFLKDQGVAATIVRAARLTADSEVLEVGPGLGVLTHLLAKRARRVVAVELDASLASALQIDKVDVVNADILRVDPTAYFDGGYTVVANLPYHITSPALRHLLAGSPDRLVVMVQAEVGERIASRPGGMSALAVVTQAQANVRIVSRVPADAFYPRPKVDSAVLALEPHAMIPRKDIEAFTQLVHAGFKQPRKTLANSLSEGLAITRNEALTRLARANLDPKQRPQELSVEEWLRLYASDG